MKNHIVSKSRRGCCTIGVLLALAGASPAMAKTAVSTGWWGNGAIWSPPGVPTAADNVIIPNGILVSTRQGNLSVPALADTILIQGGGVLRGNSNQVLGGQLDIQTRDLQIDVGGLAYGADGTPVTFDGGSVIIQSSLGVGGPLSVTIRGQLSGGNGRNGGSVIVNNTNVASQFDVLGGLVTAGDGLWFNNPHGNPGDVQLSTFAGFVLVQPLGPANPLVRAGDTINNSVNGGDVLLAGNQISIQGLTGFPNPNVRGGDSSLPACGGSVFLTGVGAGSIVQTVPPAFIESGQPGWPNFCAQCTVPPRIVVTGVTTALQGGTVGQACNVFWEPPTLVWSGMRLEGQNLDISGGEFIAQPQNPQQDRIIAQDTLTISTNPGDGVLDLSALPLTPPGTPPWFSAGTAIIINSDNIILPPGIELNQLMSPPPQVRPGRIVRLICISPTSGSRENRGGPVTMLVAAGNCGGSSDTLTVSASDTAGWLIGPFSQNVVLPSMEFFQRELIVAAPANANPGDFTIVTWEARSVNDPTVVESVDVRYEVPQLACPADFNADGQVDFFDYLDFAGAYSVEDPSADFNADGQVDFFDYLDYVAAFDVGCD